MQELTAHLKQIHELCSAHNVKSLFAFGSVVTDDLKTNSDIDLLVDIEDSDPLEYTDNYFDLKFQLEAILHRQIDLLENKAVKNPYLRRQIDNTKVLVYGGCFFNIHLRRKHW